MSTTRQKISNNEGASTAPTSNVSSDVPSTEDIVNNIKNVAEDALGQAKEKVTQVADQAQQKAKSQLAGRKDQVADNMDNVANVLRHTSEQLQGQNAGMVGEYVVKAANKLSDVSRYVRQNDIDQLLHEVEGFARREPAIALGSAFAIGVIAARFLKSSNQRRSTSGYRGQYENMNRQLMTRTSNPNNNTNTETQYNKGKENDSSAGNKYNSGSQRGSYLAGDISGDLDTDEES